MNQYKRTAEQVMEFCEQNLHVPAYTPLRFTEMLSPNYKGNTPDVIAENRKKLVEEIRQGMAHEKPLSRELSIVARGAEAEASRYGINPKACWFG